MNSDLEAKKDRNKTNKGEKVGAKYDTKLIQLWIDFGIDLGALWDLYLSMFRAYLDDPVGCVEGPECSRIQENANNVENYSDMLRPFGRRRIDFPKGDHRRPPAFFFMRVGARLLGFIDFGDYGCLKHHG